MLLPLAKRIADGALVTIDEVDRGLDCRCVCPFCEEPVVARKGNVRDHCFAHAARAVNEDKECPASFERCLFWMARRVLAESSSIWLPSMDVRLIDGSIASVRDAGDVSYSAVEFPFSKSEQTHHFSESPSDVVLLTCGDYKIALVVRFLMPPIGGYEDIFIHDGENIATVTIDLAHVKARFEQRAAGFRDDVSDAVLRGDASTKRWLYHPRADRLKRRALGALPKPSAPPTSFPPMSPHTADGDGWVRVARGTDAKTGRPLYTWHRKSEWK